MLSILSALSTGATIQQIMHCIATGVVMWAYCRAISFTSKRQTSEICLATYNPCPARAHFYDVVICLLYNPVHVIHPVWLTIVLWYSGYVYN